MLVVVVIVIVLEVVVGVVLWKYGCAGGVFKGVGDIRKHGTTQSQTTIRNIWRGNRIALTIIIMIRRRRRKRRGRNWQVVNPQTRTCPWKERHHILWDFEIQLRPEDQSYFELTRKLVLVDFVVQVNHWVKEKMGEKIDKYLDVAR